MTERLELLVGDKIKNIQNIHVLVLGLGGVGGYALESIVRCGIKEVTIIDADKVDITNLNRQIVATTKTIGMYKVDAFYERLKEINPNLIIHKIIKYITPDNLELNHPASLTQAHDAHALGGAAQHGDGIHRHADNGGVVADDQNIVLGTYHLHIGDLAGLDRKSVV